MDISLQVNYQFPEYVYLVTATDEDGVIQECEFENTGSNVLVTSVPTLNENKRYFFKAWIKTNKPFYTYFANTYSGSLFGLKPLPTVDFPIPLTQIRERIKEGMLVEMARELSENLGQVLPEGMLEYAETITDKLERFLLYVALHGIYYNGR